MPSRVHTLRNNGSTSQTVLLDGRSPDNVLPQIPVNNGNRYDFNQLMRILDGGSPDSESSRAPYLNFVERTRAARDVFSQIGFGLNTQEAEDIRRVFSLSRELTSQISDLEIAVPAAAEELEKLKDDIKKTRQLVDEAKKDFDSIPPPSRPILYLLGLTAAVATGAFIAVVAGRKIVQTPIAEASLHANLPTLPQPLPPQSAFTNIKEIFSIFGRYILLAKKRD